MKMIKKDNLENYIIIRHKLFRINNEISQINQPKQMVPWKKGILEQDFGIGSYSKVQVVIEPLSLPSEIKDMYLTFLERKVFKWQKIL